MKWLLQQLQLVIDQKQLTHSGSSLLLCISGGCDSVALLHLLCSLQGLYQWQLNVLHFNHHIRPESEEEAEFVRELASAYQLPFYRKDAEHLRSGEAGLQEQARDWRRAEAIKILNEIKGDFIITAHHADDQLETWLLKWLRGVHLSGLHGMNWSDPPFVRPLLDFSKQELQNYLQKNDWSWKEDASNQEPKYLRNRVRNELIPLLRDLSRGGLENRIGDLDEQSRILERYLTERLKARVEDLKNDSQLNIEVWKHQPELLRRAILHKFITQSTEKVLSYSQLKRILALLNSPSIRWKFHLSGGWTLKRRNHWLKLMPSVLIK